MGVFVVDTQDWFTALLTANTGIWTAPYFDAAANAGGAGATWSDLSGKNADDFVLSDTGVLTFKASPNHEVQDEYSVMLHSFVQEIGVSPGQHLFRQTWQAFICTYVTGVFRHDKKGVTRPICAPAGHVVWRTWPNSGDPYVRALVSERGGR